MNMALGREIVNLIGLRVLHDADEVCRIGHVTVMQDEALPSLVRVLIKMVDAASVKGR
jgi:hypothetical protein